MKTINIVLSDNAHAHLKTIAETKKTNQSNIVSALFEKVDLKEYDLLLN